MPKYFTGSTTPVGFFEIKPADVDSVKISDALWQQLIAGQAEGKIIDVDDDGNPVLRKVVFVPSEAEPEESSDHVA